MFEALGLFVLGLVLLALGGDSVVKGAAGLAQRFGVSPFATGLVLVALATSVPEIAVNLHAIARGQPHLALGNAVGSNILNIGLTLGAAAALGTGLAVGWQALRPLWLVLMAGTLAVIGIGWDGALGRLEGLILLVAFVAVVAFALRRAGNESAQVRAEIEGFARTSTELWQNVLRIALAAALLYFGTRWIVESAPVLGQAWGLSPLLTGLIPVAIGTTLPETAAAVVAARRGQGDLVVGHVVGSSLVNLLLVLGGMAAWNTLHVPASFVRFELPAAFAFGVLLLPLLRRDWHISRREGSVLLLAGLAWLGFELLSVTR